YTAPCLSTYFPPKRKHTPFTTFLDGECDFEQVISKTIFQDLSISYAPHPNFSEKILQADVQTHGRYLKRMLEGIGIAKDDLGFERIIIDNSSGISIPSINQLSCSNKSITVIRPSRYGVESTYDLIQTIYKKLRYFDPDSIRQDYLVWNQVPSNEDRTFEPTIEKYLKEWTRKFDNMGISLGTTIPYMSDIVSSMIADTTFDLIKIAEILDKYIQEIGQKLA
ncbi:MAG: hypothetical protein ACTSUB_06435, partial [Candidatus Thorarchaeota archaeon]